MEQEYTGGHPKASEPKTKLVRRDPERRRLQNQKAQKKYRDKRRQRIIDLENLAANISSGAVDVSLSSEDAHGPRSGLTTHVNNGYIPTLTSAQTVLDTDQGLDHFRDLGPDHVDDYLMDPTNSSPGSASANLLARNDITPFSSLTTWPEDTGNTAYCVFPRSAWKIELVECGCQVPHIRIRVPSDPGRNCPGHVNHTLAFFNFPDPYANTLRLERLCIVDAMRRNCMAIGITAEMWCSAASVSPFFRRTTHDTNTNDNLVRSVQGIFQTLKPDLRPCRRQITVDHHPYIDILPFPSLRANLIESIGAIDEDEFFHDSLNGLICWGGVGIGRRDRNGAGTGTPWDIRSWEAKEWFIQKWWFIVGGEAGELVQQSKWWRALRGEDEESFIVP